MKYEKTDMKKPVYSFLPGKQKEVNRLSKLALDMRWSWDHSADEIWRQLDPILWESTHNPWVVLQTISRDQFQSRIKDPLFREKIDFLLKSMQDSNAAPAWFQKYHPVSSLR
ncbi:MAG: DUF3417 domain-containing protein, partial [Prolixibacteraceae bacterium]|nr:DUF3417 domain-containing protein [Prolixibacteraceae bacterium]